MNFAVQVFKWTACPCQRRNLAVQVFKWTACPCQRRPPLPRASMYEKRPSPSRNQSNTVRNESLKEDLCFGSYFHFVRHESKTFCREFDISTKDTHAPRPQQESSINCTLSLQKIISNCCRRVTHVHSSTYLHSSTLMYCYYTHWQILLRVGTRARLGCG